MKKNRFLCFSLVLAIMLTACNAKTVVGPKGDQGIQGEKGDAGQAGKDGTKIYTGEGLPDDNTGVENDLYIDTDTWDIYVKGTSTWSYSGNIKGDKGDTGSPGQNGSNGESGNKIYTDNGIPSSTFGNVDDIYIDTSTWNMYRKDALEGWKLIGNIKGETGNTGSNGDKGDTGEAGKDGSKIYTGSGAPDNNNGVEGDLYIDTSTWDLYVKGTLTWTNSGNIKGGTGNTGSDGKSAYQTWLDSGHTGTEQDFLNWLKGGDGSNGVSVTNTYIDENGNLICELSNGSIVNAGKVKDTTKYKVNFYFNDSIIETKEVLSGSKVTPPDSSLIPEGYIATSWYIYEYGMKSPWTFSGCVVTSDLDIYAVEDYKEYTITYHLDDGENNVNNPSTYTMNSEEINLLSPTKDGYTFINWYTDSNFETVVTGINKGSTGNKEFYAKWEMNPFTITYNLNGGTLTNQITEYTLDDEITLDNPTKVGYTFLGWTGSNGDEPQKDYVQPKGSLGNKEYTANWSPNKYTLTVTSNNTSKGIVSIISGEGYSDETISVQAAALDENVFTGWYNNDTLVSSDALYTFSMPTNDYSLEARFFEEKFKVITSASEIEEGDEITFANTYNSESETNGGYVMSATQNTNNRGAISATITKGVFANATGIAKFKVHIETIDNVNYYSFYDSTNVGYIYAAGTRTTATNWLRIKTELDDNGRWLLNFDYDSTSSKDSSYAVQISSKGNTYVPRIRFNYSSTGSQCFSCYNESNNQWYMFQNPVLYKYY